MTTRLLTAILLATLFNCAPAADDVTPQGHGPGGKADTGWQADTSYEVGADLAGTITREATGSYSALATDRELQEQLVDTQVKFGKTTMAASGWHLNQLAEKVKIISVSSQGSEVTIRYEARVDMIHRKLASADVPTLAELDPSTFTVRLPLDPVGVYYRNREDCAAGWGDHTLADYNYYYYFSPDKEACEEPLHAATLTIREVYPVREVYPEYDRLLGSLDEAGHVGFSAALLPNQGDDDPMERFNRHKRMLEDDLGLTGEASADGKLVRYTWSGGDAKQVRMIIDLYDPTKGWFTSTFHEALGAYELVFYNGHSSYGTKPFLTKPETYLAGYQIVMMHSCRSYAYYARQVFRAKATAADPQGFALADVVATGKSSYPTDSPRALRPLLQGLMDGIVAVQGGKPSGAPSWMTIINKMNGSIWGILYGAAGVRSNAWQPPTVD